MGLKMNSADTIIRDLHACRRTLSDQFGGDLQAIVADAITRQAASGRRVVRRREHYERGTYSQEIAD